MVEDDAAGPDVAEERFVENLVVVEEGEDGLGGVVGVVGNGVWVVGRGGGVEEEGMRGGGDFDL